jgi:MoaA/NifB/PqqE/SkfB family radical SAM enzyme
MGTVYSALKVFGYPDRAGGSQGPLPAPVHIRIKPVNACNERCWYCAYRLDDLALGDEMELRDKIPEQKMFEIVDDLVAMGVRAVTFSGGGEPLIYPHIAETTRRLAAGGVQVGSLTNGARCAARSPTCWPSTRPGCGSRSTPPTAMPTRVRAASRPPSSSK